MKSNNFVVIAILFLLSTSCTNDSESDLMNPNTAATITYTNSIKSIIDNNCIFCHGNTPSNGAPMSLTTYQNVKDAVTNRGLIDRISKAQDASGMMPYGGARLPQNNIDEVIAWKNTGFKQ
jgi:uncharacterized membrane protein